MIYFDITKTGVAGHHSGLNRVSRRLREECPPNKVRTTKWLRRTWVDAESGRPLEFRPSDWVFTAELFSEAERPGFWEFLHNAPCGTAAIFHDAIPLTHPQITWPHSVARHPEYMKMLRAFRLVLPVSQHSRSELERFWAWQGAVGPAQLHVVHLGADFHPGPRVQRAIEANVDAPPVLVSVGIIEPRKNQAFLAGVLAELWAEGERFRWELVGRTNPHFGRPVLAEVMRLTKPYQSFHYWRAASDQELRQVLGRSRLTLFPTVAEGCGLPVLESLWAGRPCFCSDLPVLRENADGGGCVSLALNDTEAWKHALRRALHEPAWVEQLAREGAARRLPTWADCAAKILALLAAVS